MRKTEARSHRILRIRLPAPCCEDCSERADRTRQALAALEHRVEGLESALAFDRSLEMTKLKIQAALDLFRLAMTSEAGRGYFVSNPVVLAQVFSAAYGVVEDIFRKPDWCTTAPKAEEFERTVDQAFEGKTVRYANGRSREKMVQPGSNLQNES